MAAPAHGGDIGIDGGGAPRGAVPLRAHRLKLILHVLDGGALEVRPGSPQGLDEAATDALVSAKGVARAVGVRLEPDRQQIEIKRWCGPQAAARRWSR